MNKYKYRIIGIVLLCIALQIDYKIIFGVGDISFTMQGIGVWAIINFIPLQMLLVNGVPIIFRDKRTWNDYGTKLDHSYQLKNKYLIIADHSLTLLIVLSCVISSLGFFTYLASRFF